MISGGNISSSGSVVSKGVESAVRALFQEIGISEGLQNIRIPDISIPELKLAARKLKDLAGEGGGLKGIGLKFASKAPDKIYPTRGEVFGNLLATLDGSKDPKVKALAADMAVAWFKTLNIPIEGKYV